MMPRTSRSRPGTTPRPRPDPSASTTVVREDDDQEVNFAGPYGENGFLEDYTDGT
jgi:hypothetical protein